MDDLEREELQYALDNDCYCDEVAQCDQCGANTCEIIASIWSDYLVICDKCHPRRK